MGARHESVLLEEAVAWLQPVSGRVLLDGTLGLGGHARRWLEQSAPDGQVVGFDRDPQALLEAGRVLKEYGDRAMILQGNLRYFLQNNNVLLAKGATDIIISRNKIAYNRTGNQGMTKAGTGDVLAGLAVGFLAKTKDLFKSAIAAAYINGHVGDILLKKKKGYTFIASDLVEDLGKISGYVRGKRKKRR